jgi:hypothetical protein
VDQLHQVAPLTTVGGALVRTGGLVGGVRDGDVVGDAVPGAAVPGTDGVVVGAALGVELCPVPEPGAVAAAVGVLVW